MNIAYEINGNKNITGIIQSIGTKNLINKLMLTSLLSLEISTIIKTPNIKETLLTKKLIISSGTKIIWKRNKKVMLIYPCRIKSDSKYLYYIGNNRIPILFLSILSYKFIKVITPSVNGDNIGVRSIHYHVNIMKEFGIKFKYSKKQYGIKIYDKISNDSIYLEYSSVGATETCLFLSMSNKKGYTILYNIAIEPEIMYLINVLRSMGVIIWELNHRSIIIFNMNKLYGMRVIVCSDRVDISSWACLACGTNGKIEIKNVNKVCLKNFLYYYKKVGGGVLFLKNYRGLFYKNLIIKSIELITDIYPGFSTDYQQLFSTILIQLKGISILHETVYSNRLKYLKVLMHLLYKNIIIDDCLGQQCRYKCLYKKHMVLLCSIKMLDFHLTSIKIPDLRAGIFYIIFTILCNKTFVLSPAIEIERGYGNLICRLKYISLKIKRIKYE